MPGGAYDVYNSIKNSFTDYIKAQYFANSQLLLNAVDGQMKNLYREPYIESTPAYKTILNGIAKAELPLWMKKFFNDLIQANLGVYANPYEHQVQSLELAAQGKDLLVSTGTGSGKTECFTWPLVAKLAAEAKNSPDTWQKPGVRAIIMYPMNALVSDQIGRLRKLIGDKEHKFADAFRKAVGSEARRPQFGMYTGRTPYPGKEPNQIADRKLEQTLKKVCRPEDEKKLIFYNQLLKQGKIPAVENMKEFLSKLHKSQHIPNPEDAELITRFEMQKYCPDILVTNYSMLEYMLFRPREEAIWDSTKKWLDASSQNRILFIIDEAHMYRGSAGGEVSLLIRRLFHKLGISRERVQFILTTASMPNKTDEDKASVHTFVQALTAADHDDFSYVTEITENLSSDGTIEIPMEKFSNFNIEKFERSNAGKLKELNLFFDGIWSRNSRIEALKELQKWLYDHLLEYKEFNHVISLCRGNAVSLNEIAKDIFGCDNDTELNAVSVILTIAPFAKDTDGRVLFPARMHMFFKGITGIYACMNEDCTHKQTGDGITLGNVFLTDSNERCPDCQGAVYELYNDRRCGALYIKGYISVHDLDNQKRTYLWRSAGMVNVMASNKEDEVKEIYFYIPPKDFKLDANLKRGKSRLYPCYMDTKSGFISFEPTDTLHIRKLYYCKYFDKNHPDTITFLTCPKCKAQFKSAKLTSFKVHGNEPFYSIAQAQFKAEPPVFGKSDDLEHIPNQGRKILMFSDSRQRAAKLARDMSDISDDRVARQLFVLAVNDMNLAPGEKPLDLIYGYFALEAAKHHVQIFHKRSSEDGLFKDDRKKFKEDCEKMYERALSRERMKAKFMPNLSISEAPESMQEQVLKMYCSPYRSLTDIAVSWLSPNNNDGVLDDALYEINDESDGNVTKQDFYEVFNAFMILVCGEKTALGSTFDDTARKDIRTWFDKEGFGLQADWDFSKVTNAVMEWSDDEKDKWRTAFNNFLSYNENSDRYYVDLKTITPQLNSTHIWYRCRKCSRITPFMLKGHCPRCGSEKIDELTENEKHAMNFWRRPLLEALHGGNPIHSIDTEEHTAQLSHKDQRDSMWAKTETYEMRFQDICQEEEQPVDVLSSTTTMEVGIDIGSLVAVGMRNVPPTRANYQQRAGRAGRRGASLSTIVTYCEDSPNDMRYFQRPAEIVRGEPNRPWIDTASTKLIVRHLSMIAIETYLHHRDSQNNMDEVSACEFLDNLDDFHKYLQSFEVDKTENLVPKSKSAVLDVYKQKLLLKLNELKHKRQAHPELYEDDEGSQKPKSLLDALYEEGIIPTYSFPKNVVSAYIPGRDGKLQYQVERSLNVAVNEYASGRSIVVDKVTYEMGGIYNPSSERHGRNRYSPAKEYMEDNHYHKQVKKCSNCNWFGLAETNTEVCPFCGNKTELMLPMVIPWGFAPKNGNYVEKNQAEDIYSKVFPPLYSTIPEQRDLQNVDGCQNIRMAVRPDQQIIVLNCGPDGKNGFMVCKDCGAAVPGNKPDVLQKVNRPYRSTTSKCRHLNSENVNIGFYFQTDMFVLEFPIDESQIDTLRWLKRAALSLSEAFRLQAARTLDIDFTELVSGYRIRRNESGTFVDIYFYDDLSSGAGYSTGLAAILPELIKETEKFLRKCHCDTACYDCLKHYRNQAVHDQLDRYAALQLLLYGKDGTISAPLAIAEQIALIEPIKGVLQAQNIKVTYTDSKILIQSAVSKKQVVIYPYMKICPNEMGNKIFISDAELKFAKPNAVEHIKNNL